MAKDLATLSDVQVPDIVRERGIDPATWNVLRRSIYPDATPEMIALAVDYCRARNLDIIKKPIHIVPTYDGRKKRMVETIWLGIGEYRTTAARTGLYAGKDDPVYGPDVTATFAGKVTVTYPEWCRVTVYRLAGGQRCPYTETVYWREAAAMKSDDRGARYPNSMWQKRARGQLAKCAEAAALRAAFPEELGSIPTSAEMAGQSPGGETIPFMDDEAVERAMEVARGEGREGLLRHVQTLSDQARAAVRDRWDDIVAEADKAPRVVDVEAEIDYDAHYDAIDNAENMDALKAAGALALAACGDDTAAMAMFKARGAERARKLREKENEGGGE